MLTPRDTAGVVLAAVVNPPETAVVALLALLVTALGRAENVTARMHGNSALVMGVALSKLGRILPFPYHRGLYVLGVVVL